MDSRDQDNLYEENRGQTQGCNDPEGNRFKRRMSDHRMQQWADSPMLKVGQYLVSYIVLPILAFVGTRSLERLDKIEGTLNDSATKNAMFELRVQALEKSGIERDAAIKILTERSLQHGYELKRLSDEKR